MWVSEIWGPAYNQLLFYFLRVVCWSLDSYALSESWCFQRLSSGWGSYSTSKIVKMILGENEWEWIECFNVFFRLKHTLCDNIIYNVDLIRICLSYEFCVALFWIILAWVIILCLVRIFIDSLLYWLMTRGLVEVIILTTEF